jgi:hypothetical protein
VQADALAPSVDASDLGVDGASPDEADAAVAFDGGEVLDFTVPDAGASPLADGSTPDAGIGSKGYLTVESRKRAMLFVDTKRIGLTPVERLELNPGRYRIKVRAKRGLRRRWVEIKAGEEARVSFDF